MNKNLIGIIMAKNKEAAIKKFWKFFEENHKNLVDDENDVNESVYMDVFDSLKEVHEDLVMEIGHMVTPLQIVISGDGIEEVFEFVDEVHNHRPKIAGWEFVKYRQAKEDIEDQTITIGDDVLNLSEILFDLVIDDDAGIVVIMFIPGYDAENNTHEMLRWVILDNSIGEYDAVKKVGYFDTYSTDEISTLDKEITEGFRSLKHLKKDLNDLWEEYNKEHKK